MGSNDNWSDVVMSHKPAKSVFYIKIDPSLCFMCLTLMVEMPT
jgi:hypothetical protein